MFLKIEIVNCSTRSIEDFQPIVFDMMGGTIGRSQENTIVLPDESKSISRHHAHITYENGRYYLVDTSRNCTTIINRNIQLQNEGTELFNGDRIEIGAYELAVSMMEPRRCEPEVYSVEDSRAPDSRDKPTGAGDFFSIDDFFKDSRVIKPPVSDSILPLKPGKQEATSEEFVSQAVSEPDTATSARKRAEAEQANVPQSADADRKLFEIFLEGAQIKAPDSLREEDIPDVMMELGAVFRELVSGLWTILQGRAQEKSELRTLMTGISHIDNNPLKFSPRAEDALANLIKRQHPAYLAPADAARNGFEDIMNHHVAMNAGIQAALIEVLDRFAPSKFAEKHKENFALLRKSRCWDEFCQSYEKLREQAGDDFFGEAFVTAYEEQVQKLRSKQHHNDQMRQEEKARSASGSGLTPRLKATGKSPVSPKRKQA